jgi:hypothetical protein
VAVTVYFLSNTDSDQTGGLDFNKALVSSSPAIGTISFSVNTNTTETSFAWTPAGLPGLLGITGSYTVRVVVSTANNNGRLAISLSRVNSAGVVQTTSTATAEQTTSAGTLTFSLGSVNLGTWAAGDRLRVNYVFRNASTMTAITLAINADGLNTDVDVPWTDFEDHLLDASPFVSVAASASLNVTEGATRYGRPVSDVSVGAWVSSNGLNLFGVLNEVVANDEDYISTATPGACTVALNTASVPGPGQTVAVRYRAASQTGATLIARLKQGNTTIASVTHVGITSTFDEYSMTLTASQLATITDYSALRVELEAA